MITVESFQTEVRNFEIEIRQRVADAFETAEEFVEGLRPILHGAVNDLRKPVVTFVAGTVDSVLEIRERGENLAATVQRDAQDLRDRAEDWVKKFVA